MKKLFRILLMMTLCFLGSQVPAVNADASTIDMTFGQTYTDTINDNNKVSQKYAFTVKESGRLSFDIKSNQKNNLFISIRTKGGSKVYEIAEAYGNLDKTYIDILSGSYTIEFMSALGAGLEKIDYSITINFNKSNEDIYESYDINGVTNNTMDTARNLGLVQYNKKQSIKGQFAVNDVIDIYMLKLTKPGTMYINYNGPAAAISFQEMQSFTYACNSTNNVINKSAYLEPGIYYIRVGCSNVATQTGDYTFSFEFKKTTGPAIKTVTSKKKGAAVATCSKKKGAIGYEWCFAKDKKFKKGVKKVITKKASVNCKGLKKGTKYYVRVRAIYDISKDRNYVNYYSTLYYERWKGNCFFPTQWSKEKKVKVK